MNCRFCDAPLIRLLVDLNDQPSANRLLTEEQLNKPESIYPLRVFICDRCLLVQLADVNKPSDIFTDNYVYFSSYAKSWVEHARRYVDMIVERFGFGAQSFVVEIASNDGYLLQYFVARDIPCLGVDPAANVVEVARAKGVETHVGFFGAALAGELAAKRGQADLIIGNNVLAHVPTVNDFVAGLKLLLKPTGVITMEFPHLARLIENVQFDTIYDEHFSYFSFFVVRTVFRQHGLEVFDVEELPTHGGSLRIYARHRDCDVPAVTSAVGALLAREHAMSLDSIQGYAGFKERVEAIRDGFLAFIANEKRQGHRIAAFGAAAKGNTFLNYCGIKADSIDYVVDDTPAKQGKYLPGSHIPVVPEERVRETKPDVIVILPWNLKTEIMRKLDYARAWGCQFVTCIPWVAVS